MLFYATCTKSAKPPALLSRDSTSRALHFGSVAVAYGPRSVDMRLILGVIWLLHWLPLPILGRVSVKVTNAIARSPQGSGACRRSGDHKRPQRYQNVKLGKWNHGREAQGALLISCKLRKITCVSSAELTDNLRGGLQISLKRRRLTELTATLC